MKNEALMLASVAVRTEQPPQVMSIPRPTRAKGQVLIRVQASGINPLDLKILAGAAAHAKHPLPAVLGIDVAGEVLEPGAGVAGLKAGDKVFGLAGGVSGMPGSLVEYAAVDADLLAIRPETIEARDAASIPLVFITAWEGLVDRAGVSGGQTVLVHGGGGGVGHVAVQLAAARGARVFATGSAKDREYIEHIGATFIDYRNDSVEAYVNRLTDGRGFDIVYDTIGGATLDASFRAVRRYGHVISCLGWGTHALAPLSFRGATYSGVFTLLPLLTGEGRAHVGDILREAAMLISQRRLIPRVDPRAFSLHSVADAYHLIEERSARGKLVVDIAESK